MTRLNQKNQKTIRVSAKKLTGPNIVGKIVLPVEKPKTSNAEKRKRKRVRKVDVTKKQNQGVQKPGGGSNRPNKPRWTE